MITHLRLQHTGYESVTREADPTDDWDRNDTATDWTVGEVYRVAASCYDTVSVPFDVPVGTTVYPVYAIWSSGDSFGHDDRGHFEFIDVFTTEQKAKDCIKSLNGDDRDGEKYTCSYIREDGARIQFSRPWVGYFESLDELTYEFKVVQDGD